MELRLEKHLVTGSRRIGRTWLSLAIFGLVACGPDRRPDSRSLEGVASSGWEAPRRLERDLLIGSDSAGGPTFGRVVHLAVTQTGDILVEDVMNVAVLRFDAAGLLVDSIGRRGDGPGEYRHVDGTIVLDDGSIALHDSVRRRILIFDSAGVFLDQWPLGAVGEITREVEAVAGRIAARVDLDSQVNMPSEEAWVLFDLGGNVVDTVGPFPTTWDNTRVWGTFHPTKHVSWHPDGFPLVGVSDEYHFELRRPSGTLVVERPYDPVPVSERERAAFDVETQWRERRGGRFNERILPPPPFKAAYSRILISRTGDVWVFRHGPSEVWTTEDIGGGLMLDLFREPLLVDVFQSDGQFLGTVQGDGAIRPLMVSSDTVWAVVKGPYDEDMVARYLVR